LKVLEAAGIARGLDMHVTTAASSANAASQSRFVDRIHEVLGGLEGRRIGLLGLAFKANTDDVRESPALGVARRLLDSGVELAAFDPRASASALRVLPNLRIAESAEAALAGADAAVIATEWPEFIALPWPALRARMLGNVIVDGRRILDPIAMRAAGFRYVSVGSPIEVPDTADETGESLEALRPRA
jgi:UDPglucose 6-dehydrogenase